MPCCICNKYLTYVPVVVLRGNVDDPVVQNLERCSLGKILRSNKRNIICNDCISVIDTCARGMEEIQDKRTKFRSEATRTDVRCLVCSTKYDVKLFRISEADSRNYTVKELVQYDQKTHACGDCISLIDQLDWLTQQYFITETGSGN